MRVAGPPGLQRVVLTGSECTGKTTLATELAARFGCLWVPEYVRGYMDARGGEFWADPAATATGSAQLFAAPFGRRLELTYADVEPIARGQIEALESATRASSRVLIQDTDLISTAIYSRHYYGDCPDWIENAARERRAQLYLLLHPDVPWLEDPQRDRGDRRGELHALFAAALAQLNVQVVDVRGSWAERSRAAHAAVEDLLAKA